MQLTNSITNPGGTQNPSLNKTIVMNKNLDQVLNMFAGFLQEQIEDMVLYITNNCLNIAPIDCTDYPRDQADEVLEMTNTLGNINYKLYIFEDYD